MSKTHEDINETLAAFIERQHMFFVATAPLSGDGHVNVSPKGHDTFTIIDRKTVAYLELTGSGSETAAHLRENGRIVLMWCAFEGPPNIVRIHGRGRFALPGTEEFERLRPRFGDYPGVRSIVVVEATRVSDSCGYTVPKFTFDGDRDQLTRWAIKKGPDGLDAYRRERNRTSVDGLPSFHPTDGETEQ